MKKCDSRYLSRGLLKASLTSVSLLTLASCVAPALVDSYWDDFTRGLRQRPELICLAMKMDKDTYHISEDAKNSGWHRLTLKDRGLIEEMIRKESLDVREKVGLGREIPNDLYIGVNESKKLLEIHFRKMPYSQLEFDSCERILQFKKKPYAIDVGSSMEFFNLSKPTLTYHQEDPLFFGKKRTNYDVAITVSNVGELNEEVSLSKDNIVKRADWELIHYFNVKAYDIWNKYLESFSNEEIREMFSDGDIDEFLELKEEVEVALTSASFKTTYNQRYISHYHPAFAQIILDLYISYDNFNLLDSRIKAWGSDRDREYGEDGSIQITDKRSVDFIIGNKKSLSKVSPGLPHIAYEAGESLHNFTSVFSNLAVIIQTFSHKDCYEWGLRPEITRFLVPYRLSGMEPFIISGNASQLNELYERHITSSLFSACGDIGQEFYIRHYYTNETYPGTYKLKTKQESGSLYTLFSPYIVIDHEDIMEDAVDRAMN